MSPGALAAYCKEAGRNSESEYCCNWSHVMDPARLSLFVTAESAASGSQSGASEVDGRYADAALARGPEIELIVDGHPLRAFQGESVAAALLAAGKRALRTTSRTGDPRWNALRPDPRVAELVSRMRF